MLQNGLTFTDAVAHGVPVQEQRIRGLLDAAFAVQINAQRLAQLAREVGVTPECLYKWKRVGIETARLGTLARIADVLGCKVDDLFD